LRANSEYLEKFVEGYQLCPYAREARRRGETKRFVHFQTEKGLQSLADQFTDLANDANVVVVQVIFPGLICSPREWIEFCHRMTRLGHERRGGSEVMANAALHPGLPYLTVNPYALIPLFRRAPDPTIQWVRLRQLEQLYEGRAKGSTFVDPMDILAAMEAPSQKSLYDRVAEANQAMAQRLGIESLAASLEDIHSRTQAEYQLILQR
jgi:hypothetical protein